MLFLLPKDLGKTLGETGAGVEPVEISGAGQYATITRMGANFTIELPIFMGWQTTASSGSIGLGQVEWTKFELTSIATSVTPAIIVSSASTSAPGQSIAVDFIIITKVE